MVLAWPRQNDEVNQSIKPLKRESDSDRRSRETDRRTSGWRTRRSSVTRRPARAMKAQPASQCAARATRGQSARKRRRWGRVVLKASVLQASRSQPSTWRDNVARRGWGAWA